MKERPSREPEPMEIKEVKWANICLVGLLIFAFVFALHNREDITTFFRGMTKMGPEHSADERYWGFMAAAMVLLVVGGLLRAVIEKNRRE